MAQRADRDEAAETTSLLPSRSRDSPAKTWNRRRSSNVAFQPPYHENHEEHESDADPDDDLASSLAIWIVVPVSLLGVFIANADGSLIVASSQAIASEFNALLNAQWLVTSYGLAQCASQPLYGKLCNVFGRKANLITAYLFFAAGCFLCGVGQTLAQVLAGRAISGVGGAGMTALVSVIIADMVPIRDVAAWRSYVNVAATTGRALGGPVGGWLTDSVGWRWCFYGQVPFTLVGLGLILWKMPPSAKDIAREKQTLYEKINRIDFVGAISLATAIITFLFTLDFVAKEMKPLWIGLMGGAFVITSTTFYFWEKHRAKEPILPLRLLISPVALTSYLLGGFQLSAQYGTFYSTPLYYQIVADSTVAKAGLRLVPAVVGNALAGLFAGWLISRQGRYKRISIFATIFATTGYVLITWRWRGTTNWPETLYIFAGGFGSGAVQSTTFIHLVANFDHDDMAIAGTTLYLTQNVFLLVGIQTATTILHAQLRGMLATRLRDVPHRNRIIDQAVTSVRAIRQLPKHLKSIVTHAYVDSLTWTFGASVVWAVLGVTIALSIQEKALE